HRLEISVGEEHPVRIHDPDLRIALDEAVGVEGPGGEHQEVPGVGAAVGDLGDAEDGDVEPHVEGPPPGEVLLVDGDAGGNGAVPLHRPYLLLRLPVDEVGDGVVVPAGAARVVVGRAGEDGGAAGLALRTLGNAVRRQERTRKEETPHDRTPGGSPNAW